MRHYKLLLFSCISMTDALYVHQIAQNAADQIMEALQEQKIKMISKLSDCLLQNTQTSDPFLLEHLDAHRLYSDLDHTLGQPMLDSFRPILESRDGSSQIAVSFPPEKGIQTIRFGIGKRIFSSSHGSDKTPMDSTYKTTVTQMDAESSTTSVRYT